MDLTGTEGQLTRVCDSVTGVEFEAGAVVIFIFLVGKGGNASCAVTPYGTPARLASGPKGPLGGMPCVLPTKHPLGQSLLRMLVI